VTGSEAVSAGHDLRRGAAAAGLTAVLVLPLYLSTLLPGIAFWDTGEFQTVGAVLGIAHPTGYPTYTLLLWLASVVLQPFGEPALRANMLSAVLVATGCGLIAGVTAVLAERWLVGLAAGLALALAPTVWSVALHADPHALHLAFVALLLVLLLAWQRRETAGRNGDRWLIGAAVVFGLSMGNHALTLLLAPGIALFLIRAGGRAILQRRRLIVSCALALVLTTIGVYLYLPLRSAMDPPLDYANPQTLEGFLYVALGLQFSGSFNAPPGLAEMVATVIGSAFAQLGPLALAAPIGALVLALRERAVFALTFSWWLVTWLFALIYVNADIERYYLVPLAVSALWAGVGAGAAWDFVAGALPAMRQPGALARVVVGAVAAVMLIVPTLLAVPAHYAQVDESDDLAARQWLAATLPALARDSVVISWWSYSTALWYAQLVEHQRPDVFVVDDRTMIDQHLGSADQVIDRFLGRRPVYVIRLGDDLAALQERYVLTPVNLGGGWPDGTIYRVDGVVLVGA
jgi:Protein O-mannosyl-transferase TMEM260-like